MHANRKLRMKLQHAKLYASEAHKAQTYSGDQPYTKHLYAVESVLRRFGITDEDMLCAAWLHDVVEDTPTTVDEIRQLFGDNVSALVYAVTNEAGANRAERHARTYHKIQANDAALQLKLADRIANVEACIEDRDSRIKMYRKEWDEFKSKLYKPGLYEDMWRHLEFLIE